MGEVGRVCAWGRGGCVGGLGKWGAWDGKGGGEGGWTGLVLVVLSCRPTANGTSN